MKTIISNHDRALAESRTEADIDLVLSDEGRALHVYVAGLLIGTVPLGAYALVRPDHDAVILGRDGTCWIRDQA